MNAQQQFKDMSSKEAFKAIQIIHMALMVGLILVFCILWFQAPPVINMNPLDGTFSLILPFVVLAAIGGGIALYNARKKVSFQEGNLKAKLWEFRRTSILRWSFLEFASIACILVFYFVEANISILFAFTLGLFAFAISRPTIDGFATDFKLNQQERNQLQ